LNWTLRNVNFRRKVRQWVQNHLPPV
jgi:hypothetical protein